jgi:glycosyltransferase involved in cell wall biosynthesis
MRFRRKKLTTLAIATTMTQQERSKTKEKKGLRIAIICDPIHDLGGALISTIRFARKLTERGHTVIFLAAKYPGTKEVEYFQGIKTYRFPACKGLVGGKGQYYALPNKKKIRDILEKERIELVHFMLPTLLANVAITIARERGVPVVGHSHSQPEYFLMRLPRLFKPFQGTLAHALYQPMVHLFNKADVLICPTLFSKRILEREGVRRKCVVISNGVDTSVFTVKNVPGKLPFSETKRILFVGRLDPEKNIPVLLRSIPHIEECWKNFEVCIAGDGSKRQKLMHLAEKIGNGKVRFLGKVTSADLVQLYTSCDLFVLPSLVELEGMVVLEAMACGKPILIANSPLSASPHFVDGNGFLFDPHDPKDLALKATRLLKDSALREKMGRKSRALARTYDIERSVSALEYVYYSLLKGKDKTGKNRKEHKRSRKKVPLVYSRHPQELLH